LAEIFKLTTELN